MTSTLLTIPFRRSYELTLSDALKKYISAKYDQHPEMFTDDLLIIDRLRNEAIAVQEAHSSGVTKLLAYIAQLKWIGGKFPVDVGMDFSWFPALGFSTDRPVTQNNLRFELANVLFNLAALYSHLAVSLINSSTENIKTACKYFCNSAGVIAHLRVDILPDLRASPPDDMDDMTLRCLEEFMLAQAQECFWRKSVIDELRDASIARLAIKVSDLYSISGEYAIKSDAITTDWIHHMSAKRWHFAAAAQLRQSLDCLEKRKYGEEIARLRESLNGVNEALKESKWISKLVVSDLNGLRSRVMDDLKRAEKDNDIIYLKPVPPKTEIKPIERASMVAAKAPIEVTDALSMIGENAPLGAPLFSKLVPYSVHIAASIYTDRRDRLVNQTLIGEVETMTMKLRDILQSLNLPGSLQALEKPLGLPPSLITHAEEIRQQDGLNRLYQSMQDTSRLKANDQATYNEGTELLMLEKKEDDAMRLKYGTERWTREPSEVAGKKFHQQLKDIDGYMKAAEKSDGLISAKLRELDPMLRLMMGTNRDLEAYVPSSRRAVMTPQVQKESARLRNCLNDVSRMESRRKRRIETLKDKAKSDNIHPALLKEAERLERELPMQNIEPGQFEDLIEERLHRYDSDRDMLEEEALSQTRIIEELHEANRAFNNARNVDVLTKSSTSDRERALQELENAYVRYKEIISNIEGGRKFYNDLARVVGKYREECKKFVHARRAEAQHLESDVINAASMASLSISPPSQAPGSTSQEPPEPQARTGFSSFEESVAPQAQAPSNAHFLDQQQPGSWKPPVQSARPPSSSFKSSKPTPTIPTIPPPQANTGNVPTSPVRRAMNMTGVAAGTWSPGMPIKFGAPQPAGGSGDVPSTAPLPGPGRGSATSPAKEAATENASPSKKRVWDPVNGLRFA